MSKLLINVALELSSQEKTSLSLILEDSKM